jgi:hypothetical protein
MNPNIKVQKQKRKSLVMKVTPRGIQVIIPEELDKHSDQVRNFIRAGLKKLPRQVPAAPRHALSRQELLKLVASWSKRLGVQIARLQIRPMRAKWASCSAKGTLTLNSDVLRLPRELLEYVVCHELIHQKLPNHGKAFRVLMGCYIPDWQQKHCQLMFTFFNPESSRVLK